MTSFPLQDQEGLADGAYAFEGMAVDNSGLYVTETATGSIYFAC